MREGEVKQLIQLTHQRGSAQIRQEGDTHGFLYKYFPVLETK